MFEIVIVINQIRFYHSLFFFIDTHEHWTFNIRLNLDIS